MRARTIQSDLREGLSLVMLPEGIPCFFPRSDLVAPNSDVEIIFLTAIYKNNLGYLDRSKIRFFLIDLEPEESEDCFFLDIDGFEFNQIGDVIRARVSSGPFAGEFVDAGKTYPRFVNNSGCIPYGSPRLSPLPTKVWARRSLVSGDLYAFGLTDVHDTEFLDPRFYRGSNSQQRP